jgi:hypothetical protein
MVIILSQAFEGRNFRKLQVFLRRSSSCREMKPRFTTFSRGIPDPDSDNNGLDDQKQRGPKEARESLGFQRKPIVPEDALQMQVRLREAEVMACRCVWGTRIRG